METFFESFKVKMDFLKSLAKTNNTYTDEHYFAVTKGFTVI